MHFLPTATKQPLFRHTSGFCRLPNEVLLSICQYLSVPDILNLLYQSNKQLQTVVKSVLINRLLHQDNCCLLRLCFDQESHWRFTVDFKLTKATEGRLSFAPVNQISLRMYTSKLLRKPVLYKAYLVGPDFMTDTSSTTYQSLVDNLIKSSLPLHIKEVGLHQEHYPTKQNLSLSYKISKTPSNEPKIRPGERWVEPTGFECSFSFLSQQKNRIQRVMDTLSPRSTRSRSIDYQAYNLAWNGNHSLVLYPTTRQTVEIGGYYRQKYRYISPLDRSIMAPFLGGLTTTTLDLPRTTAAGGSGGGYRIDVFGRA
ncbi:hypothetical protein BDF20DRAFT_897058 [Mycotypha africana]|uniref:uncharacterized protein n=1 Tax=Mycotypha africana TaxID=64632 RepID=UPI002301D875|nr:uncharacterized protein BDF20DRAFT_897058 [Mycotypha africana]KAI8968559.1 hypothetical protein BDF20DRAFT_897058 [Mycotypha africana]